MNNILKEAIAKRKDPAGYELSKLRAEMLAMKEGNLEEIAALVFERKIKQIKTEILAQLETYVGDITETIVKEQLRGEIGEKGDKGDKGEMGYIGPRGLTGEKGMDGKDGIDGEDGRDGIDGIDGLPGKNGIDGISIKLEAVVEQLKPEVNKIIEDAKKTIKSIKADRQSGGGGGGGGGMGSPVTFSFAGDDTTTAFVLSSKVAANGMAIWAYVNGQWIQPGVHFNVTNSNRTLTTTFTPATGDTIEGFYLRT